MTQTKQIDALAIANTCQDARIDADCPFFQSTALADAEYAIRRLHAESEQHMQELRACEFTVANLDARIAELELQLENTSGIMQARLDGEKVRAKLLIGAKDHWRKRATEAEALLDAVGAGGVENLRKNPTEQAAPVSPRTIPPEQFYAAERREQEASPSTSLKITVDSVEVVEAVSNMNSLADSATSAANAIERLSD